MLLLSKLLHHEVLHLLHLHVHGGVVLLKGSKLLLQCSVSLLLGLELLLQRSGVKVGFHLSGFRPPGMGALVGAVRRKHELLALLPTHAVGY